VSAPQAVLLAGLFGTGKSSVAIEMADVLEQRAVPYALIDLDYLCWGEPGSDEPGAEHRMMLRNLAPVVANYLDVGVTRFVLARGMRDRAQVESLRETLGMPLTVVELQVPWDEIERRLTADLTAARADDLREAREWLASGDHEGLADLTVDNHERPLREVATEVLERLGWA
jgi:chloramphenicol 3-O-phosphotransferase